MKKNSDNGDITIDKGIPIPKFIGRGAQTKYPWTELAVGDSFLVSIKQIHLPWANLKYAPKHFSQRKTPQGIRVWRDR